MELTENRKALFVLFLRFLREPLVTAEFCHMIGSSSTVVVIRRSVGGRTSFPGLKVLVSLLFDAMLMVFHRCRWDVVQFEGSGFETFGVWNWSNAVTLLLLIVGILREKREIDDRR